MSVIAAGLCACLSPFRGISISSPCPLSFLQSFFFEWLGYVQRESENFSSSHRTTLGECTAFRAPNSTEVGGLHFFLQTNNCGGSSPTRVRVSVHSNGKRRPGDVSYLFCLLAGAVIIDVLSSPSSAFSSRKPPGPHADAYGASASKRRNAASTASYCCSLEAPASSEYHHTKQNGSRLNYGVESSEPLPTR